MDAASRQHGVITRRQAATLGVTRDALATRLARGWLRPVYRGVYHVVFVRDPLMMPMAAALAGGESAWVSHATAAALRGLHPPGTWLPSHITVLGTDRGNQAGLVRHRVASLDRADRDAVSGVPATSLIRTLLDCAADFSMPDLERAVALAERDHGLDRQRFELEARKRHGRPGAPALRRLLGDGGPLAFTRSEAEARLLSLIRRGELPVPQTNRRMAGYELDFVWPGERLVAEVDGYAYHGNRRSFESDRRRDQRLAAAGFLVLRITWHQLVHTPEATLVRIAGALARRAVER